MERGASALSLVTSSVVDVFRHGGLPNARETTGPPTPAPGAAYALRRPDLGLGGPYGIRSA